MKRLLLILLVLFIHLSASEPVDKKHAFKTDITENKDHLTLTVDIADGVHIYKSSVKITADGKPLKITLPKATTDQLGQKIYEKKLILNIPKIGTNYKIHFQGCSNFVCYPPITLTYKLKKQTTLSDNSSEIENLFNKNFFIILISFYVFGLLLSLTPCVFPTVPILSGLIVKASKTEKITPMKGFFISLIYVLSMSITYTIAGVAAAIFGKNIQMLFQNPAIIISFSLLFFILALSMFGFFELQIPLSIQNKILKKSSKAEQKGRFGGIIIMGLLSALIVGPCIAPPLAGALLYIGKTGDILLGGSALFVMSLGMGTPLLLIGLGSGKILPKAGGWMLYVNRFFGIVMCGMAIYMLGKVIPENIYHILWGVLFIATGLYLNPFSKINNYKETIIKTAAFILLITGSVYIINALNNTNTEIKKAELNWQKIPSDKINTIKKEGRVLIDVTAKWCTACKEYEETTFKNPDVIQKLKQYKLYKIDITKNTGADDAFLKKYSLFGPPAILIFENGILKEKIIGYKPPKEFLKYLN